ncbi:MAG: rhomboid family intramembrane serine protease [Desulfovibrio sp.]
MPTFFRRTTALRRRPPLWVDLEAPAATAGTAAREGGSALPRSSGQDSDSDAKPDSPMVQGAILEYETARLFALVLEARRIPCRTRRLGTGWNVQVRRMDAERAALEVRLWSEENRERAAPPPPPPLPGAPEIFPPAIYGLGLAAFHAFATRPHPGLELYPLRMLELGSGDAGSILSGQWWRLVTALTLHADGPHVLGNAVVGTLFVSLACRRLGCGLAMLLTLLGGVLGNFCNALAMGSPHDSIGFSTAVFAGAGLLAAQGVLEGRGGLLRTLVPVGAGLGLLAMLGSGGENTDLGAHLFGFVSGLALGLPVGLAVRRSGRPPVWAGLFCWSAAALLPVLAWLWALGVCG